RVIIFEQLYEALGSPFLAHRAQQSRRRDPNAHIAGTRQTQCRRPEPWLCQRLGDAETSFRRTPGISLQEGGEWSSDDRPHAQKRVLDGKARLRRGVRQKLQHSGDQNDGWL